MFRSVNSFFKMIFSSAGQNSFRPKINFYNKGCTPSYVLIARELESTKPQIFEASVYYLCTIAALKKEYQKDILDILNEAVSANKKHPERSLYIQKMLQEKKLI